MERYKLVKEVCEYEDLEIYGNEYYKILVKNYGDDDYRVDIEKANKILPTIYVNTDWKGKTDNKYRIESVTIQTTSWGAMIVEDIEKVIENYKIAAETAKEIKKMFGVK